MGTPDPGPLFASVEKERRLIYPFDREVGLRRVAVVLGWLSFVAVLALAGAVLWVERGLAWAEAAPAVICFSGRDQERLATGIFGIERQDHVVTYTIAAQRKPRSMLFWRLRESTIHLVYTSFWRQPQREAAFERIASRIRSCRW